MKENHNFRKIYLFPLIIVLLLVVGSVFARFPAVSVSAEDGEAVSENKAEMSFLEFDKNKQGFEILNEAEGVIPILPAGLTITRADGNALNGTEYTVGTSSYNNMAKFVTITTNDTLIVSGTSDAGVIIPAGRNAHLIFNNLILNCTNGMAFDINKGGSLDVILADGSSNTVTSTGSYYSAIHCGPGAKFTIDDALLNKTTEGAEVIPTGGLILDNLKLQHLTINEAGKVTVGQVSVSKGENANKLDSKNPGSLTAHAYGSAAVIGGTFYEDGGTMNFNGGILTISPNYDDQGFNGQAAGIGGGACGAGTDPEDTITFNGGKIHVQSSYHGAAIGGGHDYLGYGGSVQSWAVKSTHPSAMGNITINAGYVFAKNGGHGNAIGKGCYGSQYVMNAQDYTLKMTGGTVEAYASASGGVSPLALGATDYGANAGKQSNIIISGGSLRLSLNGRTTQAAFDGKAYGADGKEVFMTQIDLSGYNQIKKDNEQAASAENPANAVQLMNMTVSGVSYNYGAASYIDSSKGLYFWLPNSNANKEINVKLNVNDENGKLIPMDDFTITSKQLQNGGTLLKQWAPFTVNSSKITDENRLRKTYDGKPFTTENIQGFLDKLFGDGIAVDNPTGGKLTSNMDTNHISSVQSQKIYENTDGKYVPVENTEIEDTTKQAGVGKYELIISSTQYANEAQFSASFWGHRGTYDYAEIIPADATIETKIDRADNADKSDKTITFTSTIRPSDSEADTCGAPLGKVEYYAVIEDGSENGLQVKVAEADLSQAMDNGKNPAEAKKITSNGKNFNYSEGAATWTPATGVAYARNANNQYKIITKYVPGSDPNDKSNAVNYNAAEVTTPDVKITPVAQDFVVDEKTKQKDDETSEKTERIINKGENEPKNNREFTFGDHGEDGTNSTVKLTPSNDGNLPSTDSPYTYSSSDEKIATIDEEGNITFHTDGTVTFTIKKSGNAAYESASKTVTYKVNPKTLAYNQLSVNKTAQRSGRGMVQAGEVISYSIGVSNPVPGTTISPVGIKDWLPEGLSLVGSAITIRHSDGSVENKARSEVYDEETHTLKIDLGKLSYGEGCVITFQTRVDATEYTDVTGTHRYDFGNTVDYGSGDKSKKDDEAYPHKYGPVYPGTDDGKTSDVENPILVEKGCEEVEEDESLLYTMRVQNRDIVPWYNVSFKDVLPEEITLADNSLTLLPPGAKQPQQLDQTQYYDAETRTIDYPIGTLNPGEVYVVSFKCNVSSEKLTEENKTKDQIENIGSVKTNYGELNTPPVHPGETKSNVGSPVGMALSKQGDYRENAPDEITYTLALTNNSGVDAGSAAIRDVLPKPLKLKDGSAIAVKPDGTIVNLKTSDIYNEATRTITYNLSEICKAGDTWTLTFTATITGDFSLKSRTEVEAKLATMNIDGVATIADIKNTGSASGTWPGIPGGGPSWNIHTDPVGPGDGKTTARTSGGDDGSGGNGGLTTDRPDMYITKTAENWSHGYGELHIGDTIGYTIEAGNEAVGDNPTAVSENTILTEYLPAGLEVDYEGMQLIVPNATGGQRSIRPLTKVDSLGDKLGTYTVAEGTINRDGKDVKVTVMKVNAGRLKQGEKAYLYLTGKVTDKVTDIGNSVGLGEETPLAPVYPGNPDKKTPDPAEETPVVEKESKPQRKAIEYAVHIKNPTRRSTWRNVQLFDYLPSQLDIVPGSIKIERYEGSTKVEEFVPPRDIYDEESHILSYPIDRLRPGEEYTMYYEAVAKGTDLTHPIENRAGYTGEDPNGKKTRGLALNAVPATGDRTNIVLWLALAAVAAGGVAAAVCIRKRGRSRG